MGLPYLPRSAVDKDDDVPRFHERRWIRSSGVDVKKFQRLRRSFRRVMWSGCPIPFRPRSSHEIDFLVKRILCCVVFAFITLALAWASKTSKWFMSTFLPYFSSHGIKTAAARGVLVLHSDLVGSFPANFISPNTELKRGEDIVSYYNGPRNI